MNLLKLHNKLASIAPICGVCPNPPRIDFTEDATEGQKAAAWDVFNNFDWEAAEERAKAEEELAASDAKMSRVIEDVVDLLVARGVFARADLPQSAQDKLATRSALRVKLK